MDTKYKTKEEAMARKLKVDAQPPLLFRLVRQFLRHLGFAYFRLKVRGLANIPASGAVILAGNHPSVLDGIFLLILCPRPVRFLVAEELFFHPMLHWIFKGLGCIPVYRGKTARADDQKGQGGVRNGEALREAVAALKRGEIIGIYPEGTTEDGGKMLRVKRGIGLLALATGAAVIPCGIAGSGESYPQGARFPRPGRITMFFAAPLRYPKTEAEWVPQPLLEGVLAEIHREILRAMHLAEAAHHDRVQPLWWKPLQVALSALIVLPLAGILYRPAPAITKGGPGPAPALASPAQATSAGITRR